MHHDLFRPTKIVYSVFILALMLAFFLPSMDAQGQGQPALVGVDKVVRQDIVLTRPAIARIVGERLGPVAAKIAGPVAEVPVKVGDHVDEGAVIAILEKDQLQFQHDLALASLDASRSEIDAQEASIDLLSQERNRLERLRGSAAFSPARLDDKIKEILVARRRLEAVKAREKVARVNASIREKELKDAVITAPFAGVITRKMTSEGAYLRVGDPVVELLDDLNVELEADISADLAASVKPGDSISVLAGGQTIEAQVRARLPLENTMTRTRTVRFSLQNPAENLVIGQSLQVELPIALDEPRITVAKDAVTVSQNRRIVFIVDKEMAVTPRPVQIGQAIDDRFVVNDGLEEGDLVVVRGNERLRPGQKVRFEQEKQPSSEQSGEETGTAGENKNASKEKSGS